MDSYFPTSTEEAGILIGTAFCGLFIPIFITSFCYLLCKRRQASEESTPDLWAQLESLTEKQSWHSSSKLRKAVAEFHQGYARQPVELKAAKQMHNVIIDSLQYFLKQYYGVTRMEFIGSAYEGVKVAKSPENDDLEFDVNYVVMLPSQWRVELESMEDSPGHAFLVSEEKPDCAPKLKAFLESILTLEKVYRRKIGRYEELYVLDSSKMIYKWFGILSLWILSSLEYENKILLRRHGPAIQMDVYKERVSSDRPYYSVDIAPAVQVNVDGKPSVYVAKPPKNRPMPDHFTWRLLNNLEIKFPGRYNDERVDKYLPTHISYMLEIEKYLCNGDPRYILRFVGHTVSTNNDDTLQYKILIIDDRHRHQIELKPSSYKDNYLVNMHISTGIGPAEKMDARKVTNALVNRLQDCILMSKLLRSKVHVRRDGPMVRLAVQEADEEGNSYCGRKNVSETPVFYVDVILAYDVHGSLYVARPREDWIEREKTMSKLWHQSSSIDVKNELYGQLGCLKMVVRVLKVLRNQEVALAPLTSYHLKTVVIQLKREMQNQNPSAWKEEWNEKFLGERLMDALRKLENYLKDKNFPHCYLDGFNLVSRMTEDCISNIGFRISRLCKKEKEMMKALHAS